MRIVLTIILTALNINHASSLQPLDLPPSVYGYCQPILDRAYSFESKVKDMSPVDLILQIHILKKDLNVINGLQSNPKIEFTVREVFLKQMIFEMKRIIERMELKYYVREKK